MGRRRFTRAEADAIRRLLYEKATADRSRQKVLRGRLRQKYGFYISDFSDQAGGFTASDFDQLVSRGTIQIQQAPTAKDHSLSPATGEEDRLDVLPDVLQPGLLIVFCGTAAGTESGRIGAYYAGSGNKFWAVLARTRLTSRQLQPTEYAQLPEYGIGLTDLAKSAMGADSTIDDTALDRTELEQKIDRYRPAAVAFNGKRAAEAVLGREVDYGLQSEKIAGAAIFVIPSTSPLAQRYWDETHWHDLAEWARSHAGQA